MDNPDLKAVLSGMKQANGLSRLALSGIQPDESNPRGAPAPVDPLTGQFRACIAQLNGLAQSLTRQGDEPRSIDVQDYALKLQRMSVDRQDDIAKAASPKSQGAGNNVLNAAFPDINGGGTV